MLPPLALAPRTGEAVLDVCASPGQQKRLSGPVDRPHGLCAGQRARARPPGHPAGQSAPVQSAPGRHLLLRRRKPAPGPGFLERHPAGPALLRLGHGGKTSPRAQALAGRQTEQPHRPATTSAAARRIPARAGRTAGLLHLHHQRGGKRGPGLFRRKRAGPCARNAAAVSRLCLGRTPRRRGHAAGGRRKIAGPGILPGLLRKTASSAGTPPVPPASAPEKRGARREAGRTLPPECLAGPCCDPALLPPGHAALYGEHVRFIPAQAAGLLPPECIWQGALLGRLTGGRLSPAPRLRCLLPEPPGPDTALVLDDLADLAALLSGPEPPNRPGGP